MSVFSESQEIGNADVLTVINHREALSSCRDMPMFSFLEPLDTRLMKQTSIQCLIKSITPR